MHPTRSDRVATTCAALVLACLLSPIAALAQSEDSLAAGDERSRPKRSLNIKIDEHGIRIEGAREKPADSALDRGASAGTTGVRRYRELGTDIVRFGEDVYVEYNDLVRGDIVVFGGDVSARGKVIGNIVVMAGDAEILSGAEINGDVVVLGGELVEELETVVHGERVELDNISIGLSHLFGGHRSFLSLLCVPIMLFVCVVLSFLVVLFLRDRVVRAQEHASAGVLKSFGTGFLVLFVGSILVPVICSILIITIIGSPLAGMLVVSCLAVWIISRTVAAYAIGVKVNEKIKLQTENPFAIVLVGTSVLFIPALLGVGVSLWPLGDALGLLFLLLCLLICLFADLVGLGALFLSRFGGRGYVSVPAAHPAPAAPPAAA
ncbi:MAG: hypothetical protein ACE5EO_09135 [Candidatus Krumholzibacteriia bacterium]